MTAPYGERQEHYVTNEDMDRLKVGQRLARLRQALRDAGLSLHHIQAIESGQEIPDEPLEMTYE